MTLVLQTAEKSLPVSDRKGTGRAKQHGADSPYLPLQI